MTIKQVLEYWKLILAALAVTASTIWGLASFASDQVNQKIYSMEAKQALAHDYFFQQNRISIKQVQIEEHQRELTNLLEYIGDDEPTQRQHREIDYLEREIARLRQEIEEIEVKLADAHE